MKTEEDSAVTGMRLQAALIARASPVLLVQRNGRGDVAFDDIGESLACRLARSVGWVDAWMLAPRTTTRSLYRVAKQFVD